MNRREYDRLRRAGYGAALALEIVRTVDRWEDAEEEGRVRFRVEPDDDLMGALDFLDFPEWSDTRQARAAKAPLARFPGIREDLVRNGLDRDWRGNRRQYRLYYNGRGASASLQELRAWVRILRRSGVRRSLGGPF